jgi:hypothetical protein
MKKPITIILVILGMAALGFAWCNPYESTNPCFYSGVETGFCMQNAFNSSICLESRSDSGQFACFDTLTYEVPIDEINNSASMYSNLSLITSYDVISNVVQFDINYSTSAFGCDDTIKCEFIARNTSDLSVMFAENISSNNFYCITTTTSTTTSSTTTLPGTTTSSSSSSTSIPSTSTTSSSGGSSTSLTTSTTYGYSIPNANYGTLPNLNGTGGNMSGNGSIKDTSGLGSSILGTRTSDILKFLSFLIVIVLLTRIKPFKLGATISAIALDFLALVLLWDPVTGSVLLIYNFVALGSWFSDGEK